jgi:hypothetical protein
VRATTPEGLAPLLERLPEGWKPARSEVVDRLFSFIVGGREPGGVRRYHFLYEDDGEVVKDRDAAPVLDRFEWGTRSFIAEHAPHRVFVHAGVVGWKGKAILLPGRTETGKTTLTGELTRAGAAYLSDEFAVLDRHGLVHPFPKRLSVRQTAGGDQVETPVEAYGGKQRRGPMPVGLVVATSYKSGAKWRPRRLTPGRAFLELFAQTVPARRVPDRVIESLSPIIVRAPALKGVRGEAAETAQLILARMEELSSEAG